MKTKLIEDKPDRYILHDGVKPFPVFKHGLSDATHRKIQALAKGGVVHAMTGPKPRPIGRDTNTPRADKTRVEVEAGEPTITSRNNSGAHVEVQPGEPVITSRSNDHVVASDDDLSDLSVQMADGGTVPDAAPTYSFDLDQTIPPEHPAQPSVKGSELGLGSVPPGATVSLPTPDALGALQQPTNTGLPVPPVISRTNESAQRVLVPTGETAANGSPVVKEMDGFVANPLPRLREGWGPAPEEKKSAPTKGATGSVAPTVPGKADLEEGYKEQRASIEAERAAAEEGGRKMAAAQAGFRDQQQRDIEKKQAEDDRAEAFGKAQLQKVQAASDQVNNLDLTVDPGRYWASKSTGQKITGIIGMVLGAFGTGSDGVNKAAQMVNQAIDRDIEAQKAEHGFKLQKGRAAVENAQTMYGLNHALLRDKSAADSATRAMGLDRAIGQIEDQKAGTSNEIALQKLNGLQGMLLEQKAKAQQDTFFKEKAAAAASMHAQAAMMAAERRGGVKPPKNAGMVEGTVEAIKEYQRELANNPTSPHLTQMRASVERHLSKLQGGRANEYTQAENEKILPGNTGFSIPARLKSVFFPGMQKEDFDIAIKHALTTGDMPPAPDEKQEDDE